MGRSTSFACRACQAPTPRWQGRCGRCSEFGTIEAVAAPVLGPARPGARASVPQQPARPVREVTAARQVRTTTGLGEFDRVLGGGLVAGQVVLLAGEPGVGKSTLLLAAAHQFAMAGGGRTVLYVSGEESLEQIGVRARRIGADAPGLLLAEETDLAAVLGHLDACDPELVIVDSVQTVASADSDGRAGGVAQVLEVTSVLTRAARARRCPLLLIGQSTRDNLVAGPRAIEHLVDTVLAFEGDRSSTLRLLRATKNRFGAADEVVCFEQTDDGLREVSDPSGLFRAEREEAVPGTCVTVTMEGRRALLAEVQALVGATASPSPRRGVTGLDPARVAMLAAVTERSARLRLVDRDVWVATVAGARLADPAVDLAVCLAVTSACWGGPVPLDVAAVGEVALSGDIRRVPGLSQRVAEAARLGFRRVLVPVGARLELPLSQVDIVEVTHLDRALDLLRPRR